MVCLDREEVGSLHQGKATWEGEAAQS